MILREPFKNAVSLGQRFDRKFAVVKKSGENSMRYFIQSARLWTEVGRPSVKVFYLLFKVRILRIKNRFLALKCRYPSVCGQSRTRKLRNSARKRHDAHLLGSRLTSSLPQYCGGIAATSRSCESGFSFRSISQQARARGLVEKYLLEALESGDKAASAEEAAQARQRIAEGKTAAQKFVACSINNSTKRARISGG